MNKIAVLTQSCTTVFGEWRTLNVTAFAVLFFLLIAAGCGGSNHGTATSADQDAVILERMKAAKLPGAMVLAVKENQIIFSQGYGYANLEENRPVSSDTIFQIASVSKLVTATALMLLHEQGKFQLDEDIDTYLPFSVHNPRYPDSPISFRMLLTHTSSINDADSYEDTYVLGDPTQTLGDYLESYLIPGGTVFDAETNFSKQQPGATLHYSNIGFGLIGYLVERLAGEPFAQFCEQWIFAPLGMNATHWYHRDIDQSRWATPYDYNVQTQTYIPWGAYSFSTYPDGALKTSAKDFAQFLAPFLNAGDTVDGQPFLKAETVDEMLKVQNPQSETPIGLAWEVVVENAIYQHTGGDPGVTTIVQIVPEKEIGLVIFSNGDGFENETAFTAFFNAIYSRLPDELKE